MRLRKELEAEPGSLQEGAVNNEFGGEILKDKEAFHFRVDWFARSDFLGLIFQDISWTPTFCRISSGGCPQCF